MAYIGTRPTVGNFVKLDTITTSATTTFNLLNGGVAYYPQSANHCLVSLNGILQAPTDSFTISGSTIIFSSALTVSDVIDFIIVLGDVLNIGTPSDATVGFSKITSNLITGATAETSIDGADSVLIYDDSATALRKMTRTNFVAGIGATAGQVIQVVSAIFTSTSSNASNSYATTSLSCSITPSSSSNKILILPQIGMCSGSNSTAFRIYKNGSHLTGASGTAEGSRVPASFKILQDAADTNHGQCGSYAYLDSPATTSSTSYEIYFKNQNGQTSYINRTATNSDSSDSYGDRTASTLTLMEIKG